MKSSADRQSPSHQDLGPGQGPKTIFSRFSILPDGSFLIIKCTKHSVNNNPCPSVGVVIMPMCIDKSCGHLPTTASNNAVSRKAELAMLATIQARIACRSQDSREDQFGGFDVMADPVSARSSYQRVCMEYLRRAQLTGSILGSRK